MDASSAIAQYIAILLAVCVMFKLQIIAIHDCIVFSAEDQSSKTTTTTDGSTAPCSSNDVAKEPDLVEKTPKEGTKPGILQF